LCGHVDLVHDVHARVYINSCGFCIDFLDESDTDSINVQPDPVTEVQADLGEPGTDTNDVQLAPKTDPDINASNESIPKNLNFFLFFLVPLCKEEPNSILNSCSSYILPIKAI
jgi:hypothetical protein